MMLGLRLVRRRRWRRGLLAVLVRVLRVLRVLLELGWMLVLVLAGR